jgi:hypothetical protein
MFEYFKASAQELQVRFLILGRVKCMVGVVLVPPSTICLMAYRHFVIPRTKLGLRLKNTLKRVTRINKE